MGKSTGHIVVKTMPYLETRNDISLRQPGDTSRCAGTALIRVPERGKVIGKDDEPQVAIDRADMRRIEWNDMSERPDKNSSRLTES